MKLQPEVWWSAGTCSSHSVCSVIFSYRCFYVQLLLPAILYCRMVMTKCCDWGHDAGMQRWMWFISIVFSSIRQSLIPLLCVLLRQRCYTRHPDCSAYISFTPTNFLLEKKRQKSNWSRAFNKRRPAETLSQAGECEILEQVPNCICLTHYIPQSDLVYLLLGEEMRKAATNLERRQLSLRLASFFDDPWEQGTDVSM